MTILDELNTSMIVLAGSHFGIIESPNKELKKTLIRDTNE